MNAEDIANIFFNHIQFEKRYSKHTYISYRTDFAQFSEFLSSQYELANPALASYQMIRSWILSLGEAENSPRTINRKIACLRSLYKLLLKKNLIEKDPMLKIQAPKIKKRLPEFVEENEMHRLLDQFVYSEGFEGIREKLIIELLYGTGIRLSELIELRTDNINFHNGTIKVLGKGNKERIIPLNKSLFQLLNLYMGLKIESVGNSNGYFIVTDKGEQSYPMFIYRIVKERLSSLRSTDKSSPHVLRHTFATHLLNKGADLNAIKDLLGHSSLAATQVYTHNTLDKIKAVFDQAHPKA